MPVKGKKDIEEAISNDETTVIAEQNSVVDEVSPTQSEENEFGLPSGNDFTSKSKKKKMLIPIVTIVAVILAAIGGVLFYTFNKKPEAIMKDAINDAYKDFSKALKEYEENAINFDILKDSFKMSGELSVGGDLLKGLENDKIKVEVGLDAANEKFEASAILTEKNKNLLDATVFGKNGKLYIKSNNLFDNTYYIDDYDFEDYFDFSEYESMMSEIKMPSADDIDSIVKSLKNAIIKSLDKDEMKKSKEEIKINGTKVKTTKITYTIDEKSTEKFVKSMIKEIKKDDSLLEKIAEITDMDVSDLEDAIDEAQDAINEGDAFKGMGKGKFSIYTAGLKQDVVRVELVADGVTIGYSDYKDNFYFEVTSKDDDVNFEIVGETKKDVTTIDVKYNKETYATFKVRAFTSDYIDLDFDINLPKDIAGEEIVAKGSIKLTANKDGDKEVNGTFEFSLDAKIAGESINVSGKFDYKFEIGVEIADYNSSKAKEMDDMTEADAEKLMKAIEALEDTEIFEFISQFEDIDFDDLGFGTKDSVIKDNVISPYDENGNEVDKCDLAVCDKSTCKEIDGIKKCECEYFDYDNNKFEKIMCEQ